MSIDGFRLGDAPASIFFNILAARIYIRQLATLNGRGVLFAIVDDVKIAAPLAVIAEIVDTFSEVAWHEAGLTTQVIKNKIYVPSSARAGWTEFLDSTPRDLTAALPINDIPNGSFLAYPSDVNNARLWPESDGSTCWAHTLGLRNSSRPISLEKISSIVSSLASYRRYR
jgi:hypothetical protein